MVQMSDDSFARLVADDVKNKISPERRAVLQNPANYDRWKRALLALVDNLDEQIAEIENDSLADEERYRSMGKDGEKLLAAASRDYGIKKSKIKKFHFHVSRRLDQVMALIEGGEPIIQDEWDTADIYRRAIREHKRLMMAADLDPTPIDESLWDVLDRNWTMDTVDINAI